MTHKKRSRQMLSMLGGAALLALGVSAHASSDTDKKIESSVKNSHVFKTYLKDDSIAVESKGGDVTLNGTVSSRSHKSLAETTAENIAGVNRVNNKLVLKQENDQENSDGWIATKVKTTLMFHRNVNSLKTQVSVNEGIVTLQGEVASSAQKDLTAEYAKDVDGVKRVDNQLKVVGTTEKQKETLGEKIDDASITAQVKMVLVYHRSTSALNTKVKTNDGNVVLSGKAKNAAERDLVTKLVQDVNGVKNIENNMTITPETKG